jgi:hypothetical protein
MSAQRIQKAILAHLKDVHHIKEELLHSTFKAQPELDNLDKWALRLAQEIRKGDPVRIQSCDAMLLDLWSVQDGSPWQDPSRSTRPRDPRDPWWPPLRKALREVRRLLPKLLACSQK